MDGLSSALIIILMFFLRLGVPLLITMLVGYVLVRLDRKWQAEADVERQAELKAQREAAIQPPAPRPALPAGYQIPARQPAPLPTIAAVAAQPCWVVKGCSEAAKASCAAFRQPSLPCWVARTSAEGRLPPECADCRLHDPKLYQPTVPIWIDRGQDIVH